MSEELPVRRRRSFTDEFKADAVAMVLVEGRRIVDVAEMLRVGDGTLGNWAKQARIDRGEKDGTRSTQTSGGLLGEGVGTVTRYRWVAAREAEGFPTTKAREAPGVSRQSFYDWKRKVAAGPTPAEVEEARLVERMTVTPLLAVLLVYGALADGPAEKVGVSLLLGVFSVAWVVIGVSVRPGNLAVIRDPGG